jgi:hypothetical protein
MYSLKVRIRTSGSRVTFRIAASLATETVDTYVSLTPDFQALIGGACSEHKFATNSKPGAKALDINNANEVSAGSSKDSRTIDVR